MLLDEKKWNKDGGSGDILPLPFARVPLPSRPEPRHSVGLFMAGQIKTGHGRKGPIGF
jgi:hypothetical protein